MSAQPLRRVLSSLWSSGLMRHTLPEPVTARPSRTSPGLQAEWGKHRAGCLCWAGVCAVLGVCAGRRVVPAEGAKHPSSTQVQ